MIKVENIGVWGFEPAIRGMRNPMNSWDKSDSYMGYDCHKCGQIDRESSCEPKKHDCSEYYGIEIGKNDLDLMKRLYKAGSEHRKYLRQIMVSMDITAPLYWWKEFDTYKVGTVANSCSTMHKIASKPLELDDFSYEHLISSNGKHGGSLDTLQYVIADLNYWRNRYVESKNKDCWWQLIQLLPSSYNQKRTITMNYENAVTMIKQRTNHRLDEWNDFVEILKGLPYIKEIME